MPPDTGLAAATPVDAIVAGLATHGIAVVHEFLPAEDVAALRDLGLAHSAAGTLSAARIGRDAARVERPDVRGDRIRWLDENAPAPAEVPFWTRLGELRVALNRELMLGLWSFEGHYALYPPGARYEKHRDRFRDDDARVVTCILYLNEGWAASDGGLLRIWQGDNVVREVLPEAATFVAFLAERFPHEVLPARRPRLALTGWFRRRG
jgi:SM-20-related protein